MNVISANGASIPAIGLGTWRLDGHACVDIVARGLVAGYRHVDTAQMYGNEREVGEGLRASGVPRDDVFLTTKIWRDSLHAGVLERAAEERLRLLGVDQVDLLLVHWPNPAVPLADTMGAMAAVRRTGLARHIGVSNFSPRMLREAVDLCPEPLVTNQVEYHPLIDQSAVIATCRALGLAVTAYCPVARGRVAHDPLIAGIARAHGRTPAQIALRWLVQQPGVAAIPKTGRVSRLVENLAVFDFSLTADEMERLARLGGSGDYVVAPGWSA